MPVDSTDGYRWTTEAASVAHGDDEHRPHSHHHRSRQSGESRVECL